MESASLLLSPPVVSLTCAFRTLLNIFDVPALLNRVVAVQECDATVA
jgi:hypothetical protein